MVHRCFCKPRLCTSFYSQRVGHAPALDKARYVLRTAELLGRPTANRTLFPSHVLPQENYLEMVARLPTGAASFPQWTCGAFFFGRFARQAKRAVSYTHLRAHETDSY